MKRTGVGNSIVRWVTFDGYLGFLLTFMHLTSNLALGGYLSLLSVTSDYLAMFSLCPPSNDLS